jgi:cyclopropane fatty-acyl-phospholipid synthase-like methyltransferase
MQIFRLKERFAANLNLLPTAIYDAFPSVLFGRILVIASRLGVFESLHQRPQHAGELAKSLGLHPKSLELILPALTAGHYLKKRGDAYSLAPQAEKWLVKSSPHSMRNFLAYIELLHSHWMYLEETVKQGKPPETYIETFGKKEWEIYTLGMMDIAKLILPHLLPKIKLSADVRTLLDLCGSHGLYSIELCKRYPTLKATIADFPEVLQTTGSIIKQHHLEGRIKVKPCDVTKTTFEPEHFDVVFAFNIIHGFSDDTNRTFLRTIASTLKRGGLLYILDQLKNELSSGVDRLLPLMVGLNLLNEIGGNVYSFDEIKAWCSEAELGHTKAYRLSLPGVTLITASKK